MLTTLESNVRGITDTCTHARTHVHTHTFVLLECQFVPLVVPMDLDVKMKAVMLGACFLIVSIRTLIAALNAISFLGFHVL